MIGHLTEDIHYAVDTYIFQYPVFDVHILHKWQITYVGHANIKAVPNSRVHVSIYARKIAAGIQNASRHQCQSLGSSL